MLESLSDKELIEQWLAAAEQFCRSKTPDLGGFSVITWETEFEHNVRLLISSVVARNVAHIARDIVGMSQETGRSFVTVMR